ncbi:TIGR02677 family protein [Crossiella sp. CA198]|uniref:TIGR02677 family protein n=1 Tax=Crossiella sp. CA198 TaxID=3455607 RepID=UPI003F8D67EB
MADEDGVNPGLRLIAQQTESSPEPATAEPLSPDRLPGQMKVVAYLNADNAAFYRLLLDELLAEEARLGLHLPTLEIEQRVLLRLAQVPDAPALPKVDTLLEQLYSWGNVDRIQNTHRKGSYQEYLRKDYLYQLTPAGAQVHRFLTAVDAELQATGALQSSMLPEVLKALHELVGQLMAVDKKPPLREVYATLQRIINGFTRLSENAKLFIQGLNRALEVDTELSEEVFLAYKDVVVLYLQTFVMALVNYASAITQAIEQAEQGGILVLLPDLARLEAAPALGMSQQDVADQDAEVIRQQWHGLRSWFFGELDRPPVAVILQDRAADAVNRIVATVRRLNDRRFRRLNRAADLLTLATWFAGTESGLERATLWRNAFGMYSVRHLGTAHAVTSELDVRPKMSWWDTPAAPVEARLRTQGPRATTGRPAGVGDPREAKRRLAERQAAEQAANDAAITVLVNHTPSHLSALPVLSEQEFDLLLSCLAVVVSARADGEGVRTGRTSDGRLRIQLKPGAGATSGVPEVAVVRTARGRMAVQNFELDVRDQREGAR